MKLQVLIRAIEALECASEADIESRMLTKEEFMKVLRSKGELKAELAMLEIDLEVTA